MTNKNTKRALLSSVLALFLCFAMLIGTTYAWFTDSVTSAGNKIVAGTLDVDLFLWNSATDSVEITESSAPIFGANSLVAQNNAADTIWEPGKTQVAYLSIKNNGTLDLKYKVALEVTDVEKNIIDVLYYTITPDATWSQTPVAWDATNAKQVVAGTNVDTEDVKLEASKEHFFALSIHMDENAGNDYQGASVTFDIKVLATQIASESDSFDNQYDKDAIYPVNITVSKPVTADGDNKTTEDVSITFADASSAVSEVTVVVPKETKLETGATQLVLNVKEADGVNADVATQITSDQTATTYEITLDGVDATNDKDITVTLVIEKGLVDVQLYHKDTLIPCTYDADTGELTFATKGFSPFTVVSATKVFEEGEGTEDAPYIIKTAEDLLNISKYSHEYKYYKVADGVDTLDMTGIGKIKLNGSFDGNGVTMNNLTTALFQSVGKVGVAQDIKISNLTANVNTTDGNALVRNIYNPGTTTFENVALHGYIEGQYNMGSFYNYGTANAGDSDGADYTVSFVNATSDATLVCTTGNAIGGMLGHGYEGADYKLSINMDSASEYTGKMYTTGTATCYEVMAMCSHATYVLNGVETSRYENKYPSTKLTAAAPTAKVDGYYVAPVEGVDHYVVSLEAQLTAYDENGVKISNLAGLTWSLGKTTITEGFEGKIFDLVTSAKIVNDKDIKIGYDLSDGALTVYTGRDTNYESGWITLNVTQYDADGTILATGNLRVYTFSVVTNSNELKVALTNGGNVALANDVIISESLPVTKDTVLDLNGKTIGTSGSTTGSPIYLKGGKLTVKNGTLDLDGSHTNVNGTFSVAIGYDAQTELVVENVNFTGTTAINGTFATDGPLKIAISDCTMDVTNLGIAVSANSTEAIATINNCNIDADEYAIFASQGSKITINGGTYKSAGKVITSMYDNTVVTINGGTFDGELWVTGGGALVIYGGTFTADPSAYVAHGYVATQNGSVWTVSAQ